MPFDGAFVTPGNACTSPQRPSSRAISSSIRTARLASPRPWNSGSTIQPISDTGSLSSSWDHNETDPATTAGAVSAGTIILIHSLPAAAARTSRATLSSIPSRGSGPPSPAIMTGSHRIRT